VSDQVETSTDEIVGASKIARDITERKRAERVEREAVRRRYEFLARLAQEMRSPLAPIRTGAELLRRSDHLPPELRAVSLMLERQVREITHLVDDLLDVSRITSGQVQLHREPIDLPALLNGVIESYRSLFEAARQRISISTRPELIYVDGDRVRLTQVFSNIIHNAAKYTKPKGRIQVEARMEADDVVVSISDTGVGIPTEMLGQVFELFVQLDRAHELTEGGLGVGLALARTIVELHGGSIEATRAKA
jgi:signal transduction histidine kinase